MMTAMRLICGMAMVLGLAGFHPIAAADGTRISPLPYADYPDISGDLVVYFGYDYGGRNSRGFIYAKQGIYVYDRKSKKTYKVAVPVLATPTGQTTHPKIAGDFIVWDDYLVNNWDIFGCRFNRETGACPVHQLTQDPTTQWLPDVSEEGLVVWTDYRNNYPQPGTPFYGNYDVYACSYDPAAGACPARQVTTNPWTQSHPSVHGQRIAWHDERNMLSGTYYRDIFTCVYDAQAGTCSDEKHVNKDLPGTGWISAVVFQNKVLVRRGSLYLYDMSQPDPRGQPVGGGDGGDFDGSWTVWGGGNITAYDVAAQTTIPIASESAMETMPAISQGCVAYFRYGPVNPLSSTSETYIYLSETLCPPHGPVLDAIADRTLAESETFSIQFAATDEDGDALTFSVSPMPLGAGFDSSTNVFHWTPSFEQAGAYLLTASVSDGGLSDSKSFAITVTNTNQAPVLGSIGDKTIPEGALLTFSLNATDMDGDALAYSASAAGKLPDGASLDPISGAFSWTPNFEQAGTYFIPFTASDGSLQDMESITVSVIQTNQAPVLSLVAEQFVDEDDLLTITLSATDPDGDDLAYAMSALPAGAAFDVQTHTLSWAPGFDQAGSYLVTATATDPGALTAAMSFIVTVVDTNRTPTLIPIGARTGKEAQMLAFTVQAEDPDGDALTFSAHPLPAGANFNPETGAFTWMPGYDQAGSYWVAFTVVDAEGLGDLEEVLFTIENANQPPEFEPIPDQTCNEGERLQFTVSATDHDGEPVTYAASPNLPGAAFDAWTQTFSWTPGYDQQGNHEVVFTVSDPNGASQAEPVLFSVVNVNRTPALIGLGNQVVYAGKTLAIKLAASDPDGDLLTFGAAGLPKGAIFTASTGTFTWTPTSRQLGQYVVTFTVSDGTISRSQTITITVIKSSRKR